MLASSMPPLDTIEQNTARLRLRFRQPLALAIPMRPTNLEAAEKSVKFNIAGRLFGFPARLSTERCTNRTLTAFASWHNAVCTHYPSTNPIHFAAEVMCDDALLFQVHSSYPRTSSSKAFPAAVRRSGPMRSCRAHRRQTALWTVPDVATHQVPETYGKRGRSVPKRPYISARENAGRLTDDFPNRTNGRAKITSLPIQALPI
jgi:hypothetical protein